MLYDEDGIHLYKVTVVRTIKAEVEVECYFDEIDERVEFLANTNGIDWDDYLDEIEVTEVEEADYIVSQEKSDFMARIKRDQAE